MLDDASEINEAEPQAHDSLIHLRCGQDRHLSHDTGNSNAEPGGGPDALVGALEPTLVILPGQPARRHNRVITIVMFTMVDR